MSEEDILRKTQLLMKSFGREESSSMAEYSLASKQKNSALKQNETSPKDFATVNMTGLFIIMSALYPGTRM